MICSILFASRGRKFTKNQLLHRFLNNVYEMTDNIDDVEFLCKVDDDDVDTLNALKEHPKVRAFVGHRLDGYRSMTTFYNEMCKVANGTWFALFSDDLLIETKSWDSILYHYSTYTTHMLKPQHPKVFGGNLFPIMHRHLFEVVGHTGVFPADWWWDIVGQNIPLHVEVPIVIEHIGSGVDGDTVDGAYSNANHDERFDVAEANRTITLIRRARGILWP